MKTFITIVKTQNQNDYKDTDKHCKNTNQPQTVFTTTHGIPPQNITNNKD